MNKKLYLLVLLLVTVTAITLVSTYLFYRASLNASESFMSAQVVAISTTLEVSLTRYGLRQDIFKDIILNERWEGIAFLAFYGSEGTILLHSNEKMINKKLDAGELTTRSGSGTASPSYITLGTGERVFVLDTPLVVQDRKGVLRIALHPYPSQMIVERARLLFLSVSVMLVAFWIIAILFIRAFKQRIKLESVMAQNERLAMLGRMASVLAHEIRNPLGVIKGFAQYLKEQSGNVNEKTGKGIDIIIDESKRLELLTDDLLVYAKMDELRIDGFDLPSLVRDVLTSLPVKQKDIEMDFDMPDRLSVMSDKEKLRQIIYNLLQNSIDAIEGSGKISVSVKRDRDSIIISLSDNGRGIAPDELGKIFSPFYTTKAKGTGLGLAIVDKLVKALRGTVRIESSHGKYTTVIVDLPFIKSGTVYSGG